MDYWIFGLLDELEWKRGGVDEQMNRLWDYWITGFLDCCIKIESGS